MKVFTIHTDSEEVRQGYKEHPGQPELDTDFASIPIPDDVTHLQVISFGKPITKEPLAINPGIDRNYIAMCPQALEKIKKNPDTYKNEISKPLTNSN